MAKLINLAQINGGLALQQAIDIINTSYPSSKVTTQINKNDASGNNYTAEELLSILKTTVETQLGTGSGSVSDQIATAVATIQNAIDDINDKEIQDRVRITGSIAANGDVSIDDISNVTDIDKTIDYIVYYKNNTPVRDQDGNNVTYNFETNTLSDIPHVRNTQMVSKTVTKEEVSRSEDNRTFVVQNINLKPGSITVYHKSVVQNLQQEYDYTAIQDSEYYLNTVSGKILFKNDQTEDIVVDYDYEVAELTFIPIGADAEIKIFPIGTFKFKDLSSNYLLDNNELNLIAYSEAIDELAINITRDNDLIEHVISLIGTEAIQNALNKIIETLDKKFTNTDIDRQNDIADVNYRIDTMLSVQEKEETFIADTNQTKFELANVPTENAVILNINGVRYKENVHFTVNRTATKQVPTQADPLVNETVAAPELVWTFEKSANGFDLNEDFVLDVYYKTKTQVALPNKISHI